MKKIVRGNDFTLRIPVCKIVNGEQVAFPLPACTDIVVNIVNQYRRVALSYTIDTAEDNIINARVEGDAVSVGTYALEVRGKIFGNDWRSKEYEQFSIVDNNASGDTAFNGELIEGEDSVEMNTALVILPPTAELTQLITDANTAIETAKLTDATLKVNEYERTVAEQQRVSAEYARESAESRRSESEDVRHAAEVERASNEDSRKSAEFLRDMAETERTGAENIRIANETARVAAEERRETTLATTKANSEAATKKATDAASEATLATSKANASAEKANAAAVAAEKVDAALADNVLTVTNRNGESTSLQLASYAEVGGVVSEVKHLSETMGAYTDRPDIVLTAKETNKAISASGEKVSKSGWAIAEFTAEKGNVYLFKPNVIDDSVCIFAEYIQSVETSGIDYTYTYNSDGTTATATATYLGATHTYTYTYAEDKSFAITDETGAAVDALPMVYETKVGTYSPLVSLNADAELPKDGYCRYMSHFKGNSAIKVVVSYKVGVADLTMKVTRDGVFASISTQLGNLSQKENETRSLAVELKEKMATFVDTNPYVGMVRMNGDASPDAEMTFGDKQLMHEVGAEWKLATVKDGVVTHVMAPGRLTLDENGEEVKIDGSDGDVMLINRNANVINATKVIDGREMNCLAIGKTAAKWYGVESKKMPAFGMTPCETVNAKIEGDTRSQAHCVYNTTLNGMYGTADTSVLKASYINRGAGHASNTSAVSSIQSAQNKNTDPLTSRPYMGWHHGTYEALLTTMFAEIGSVDHTDVNMFGSGVTAQSISASQFNDDAISGVSGWKIIAATGETYYSNYSGSQVYVVSMNSNIQLANGLSTAFFNPVQLLEGQRILDAIAKAGLIDKIGNKANIFYYDENGNAVCASDGSVNLDTGEGMEMLKFYFVVRNVPRCEGMKDGVMTAVVNRYVKTEIADGCQSTDKKVSFDGAIAILKISIPVYRGFTLPYVGQFRQMSYAYYTIHNIDGATHVDYRCTESMEDVQPLTVFNQNAYQCAYGTKPPMLVGLNKKKDYGVTDMRESYIKSSDYNMSQFCYKTVGSSLHTHECAYLWLYPSNNGGVGTSQVRGSVVGCFAFISNVSARTAFCISHAGIDNSRFAGAFAVLLKQ